MEQGISFSPKAIWDSTSIAGKAVIIVLAIMGIYMLAVAIERWITFSRAKQRSLQFVFALQKKLADRDIKGALSLAQVKPQGPIAIVIEAALHEYIDGLQALKTLGPDEIGDFDLLDAVNRAIDRVKEREVADLKKGLGALATIASAAPFVGLLGTVVGIITVFATMSTKGAGGIAAVAGGIGEALVTTAFGLLVAIPAVMVFNFFTNSIDEFVVDMNETSSELVAFILREGRRAA
ncbi:MAG TPA: MotA/TolQ/ExbB proton channel family protein [Pseudomonadota bacterium]|jgi:biopolymer transport protein ExbB|nr:MotA/TolQ/ExbB proton channel family protein [Pseudomonadota bacterium]HNI59592.1 MotA/TolQ/ExbB proton channel family protein [Pseudomonadota bacterium]HNK45296.1 MotA/TolQ/ExbB proton channel family protein [Pseudomonadota bacterium]HNN50406.1 MotA/TolQ/ExbB proton channel family protein [Pseudomonadota bacterium]